MSIDSQYKRSSVFEVPGIQVNPFPLVGITAGDRQTISDIYMGIAAQMPSFLPNHTCWSNAIQNSSAWSSAQRSSSSWSRSGSNNSTWRNGIGVSPTWVKGLDGSSTWSKGRNVMPC